MGPEPGDLTGAGAIGDWMHERLRAIGGPDADGLFTIERVALIRQHTTRRDIAPLCMPVKDCENAAQRGKRRGDANTAAYVPRHGTRCWEVDVLAPQRDTLRALVARAIVAHRDEETWAASLEREAADQEWIRSRVQRMRRDARSR